MKLVVKTFSIRYLSIDVHLFDLRTLFHLKTCENDVWTSLGGKVFY